MSNLTKLSGITPTKILDIGANCGHWAKEAQALWPSAKITCIEGNKACWDPLCAAGFPPYIAMLGAEPATKTFFKQPGTPHGTGNSVFRENTPFFDNPDTEEVEIMTIRTLISENDGYDFAKIDAQGSELDIIRGGTEILKKCKWILMEVPAEGVVYNLGAPTRSEVFDFMINLGFSALQIVEDIHSCLPPHGLIQQDVLFSRP